MKPTWVVAIAAGAALVWLARGLLLPIFLAMMFAYLLSPIVARADALAIRRSVAVGVLFAVMITLLVGAGLLVGPRMLAEASRLVEGLPALATRIDTALDRALRELAETLPMLSRVLPEGEGWIHRLVLDRPPSEPSEFFEDMGHLFLLAILVPFKGVDDTLIQPLTIGRSVHLHPALLLGSVVVGNHTLGVLGMIIAVPVATVLQETVRLLLEHRQALARRSRRSGAGRLVG